MNIIIKSLSAGLALALSSCVGAVAEKTDSTMTVISDSITEQSLADSTAVVPEKRNLAFAFTGDIMMGTTYPESPKGAYLPANDGKNLFDAVRDILSSADIAAANLEGTMLDNGGTVKKCGNPSLCYAFRMPTKYVTNLTDAGFDFLGVANNHVNDFGEAGVASTMSTLDNAGLKYAGLRGRCETAYLERDGRKIGFTSFGYSRGTLSINDLAEVRRVVGELKKNADIVVVSFHGGGEGAQYTHVPHKSETCFGENRGDVEKFAHTAIDAGADIVYGHGPHVTRALELYNGHLVVYSLGNFCTPYRMALNGVTSHSPVVTATLDADGKFVEGKIHSFMQSRGTGPREDKSNSVAAHMRKLTLSDFPRTELVIELDGTLKKK